jgi:hypothetical protein
MIKSKSKTNQSQKPKTKNQTGTDGTGSVPINDEYAGISPVFPSFLKVSKVDLSSH